jgi:hypothetical protein
MSDNGEDQGRIAADPMSDDDEEDAAAVAAAAAAHRRPPAPPRPPPRPVALRVPPDLLQLLAGAQGQTIQLVGGPATAAAAAADANGDRGFRRPPPNDDAALVAELERHGALTSGRVASALRAAPRSLFVPPHYLTQAHIDMPIRVREAEFNISAPHMHALMLQELDIQPGDRVLDIGSGAGGVSAAAAWLAGPSGRVLGLEVRPWCVRFAREREARLRRGAAGSGGRGEPAAARRERRWRERADRHELEPAGAGFASESDEQEEMEREELEEGQYDRAIGDAERREGRYSDRAAPVAFELHNAFVPTHRLAGFFDKVHVGAACPEDRVHLLLRLLDRRRQGQGGREQQHQEQHEPPQPQPAAAPPPQKRRLLVPVGTDLRLYTYDPATGSTTRRSVGAVRFTELEVPSDASIALGAAASDAKARARVSVAPPTLRRDQERCVVAAAAGGGGGGGGESGSTMVELVGGGGGASEEVEAGCEVEERQQQQQQQQTAAPPQQQLPATPKTWRLLAHRALLRERLAHFAARENFCGSDAREGCPAAVPDAFSRGTMAALLTYVYEDRLPPPLLAESERQRLQQQQQQHEPAPPPNINPFASSAAAALAAAGAAAAAPPPASAAGSPPAAAPLPSSRADHHAAPALVDPAAVAARVGATALSPAELVQLARAALYYGAPRLVQLCESALAAALYRIVEEQQGERRLRAALRLLRKQEPQAQEQEQRGQRAGGGGGGGGTGGGGGSAAGKNGGGTVVLREAAALLRVADDLGLDQLRRVSIATLANHWGSYGGAGGSSMGGGAGGGSPAAREQQAAEEEDEAEDEAAQQQQQPLLLLSPAQVALVTSELSRRLSRLQNVLSELLHPLEATALFGASGGGLGRREGVEGEESDGDDDDEDDEDDDEEDDGRTFLH